MYDMFLYICLNWRKYVVSAMRAGAGRATGAGDEAVEDQPTMASATASATRMPSIAADMMPPA
jgi:hypothetical protein